MTDTRADTRVDQLYADMRSRYGASDPRANGYRLVRYFLREQEMVFNALESVPGVVLDIACGSGLMLKPFHNLVHPVVGVDFNAHACAQAASNAIPVVRANAFMLPFETGSIQQAISCQFLNQQPEQAVSAFVSESARVIAPGGRMVIVWRNHQALIHRFAHFVLGLVDRVLGRPSFPMVDNPLSSVRAMFQSAGFEVVEQSAVFPLFDWRFDAENDWRTQIIGASWMLVLNRKKAGHG